MKNKLIIGLLILTIPTFGQLNGFNVEGDLRVDKKHLIVDLKIENQTDESLYINTSSLWLATDSTDITEFKGLLAFLESETGYFVPLVLPITFIDSDNVKRDVRRMERLNKYPKVKISPDPFLILVKQTFNSLNIRIPIEDWHLVRGHKYKFVLTYSSISGSIKPPKEDLKQVDDWKIIGSYFDY